MNRMVGLQHPMSPASNLTGLYEDKKKTNFIYMKNLLPLEGKQALSVYLRARQAREVKK